MEHHRIIDRQLDLLRDKILLLGGATQKALQRAMQSLSERNSDLAREVLEDDSIIDQMELDVDRFCVEIFALRQPAARDLRFVISIAKITPILERIADHASSIAEAAVRINNEPELNEQIDLTVMFENAAEMLQKSLEAVTTEDAVLAREIIKQDDRIDAAYKRIFDELIEIMTKSPSSVAIAAQMLFVAKHLERIGDYVKDICELTVYMKEAVFIKHQSW